MHINDITVENRIRKDLGDVDELANSIREHGLIEPIVVARNFHLVAGERRLSALKRLGVTELTHAVHFIWNDEQDELRLIAIELEENLRRKELSWQEQVTGKQRLLELMQRIHGVATAGKPGIGSPLGGYGFGVNKLAAMLGESVGATSQDLQVATMMKQFPMLAKAETKSSALSQLKVLGLVAAMTLAKPVTSVGTKYWSLVEDDFRNNKLDAESVDLIWTDLPYGGDVDETHNIAEKGAAQWMFDDSRPALLDMLPAIANESFRVLKPDRYAVFCFGFNYYSELCKHLRSAGFHVQPVPYIWCKPTKFGVNPLVAYCLSYEPLLVAWKGSAKFIRQGRSNVFHCPPPSGDKLHLVQKPVALVEEFLLDMTTENATVVDWCAGTGTTGVACQKLKRYAILFEKDPSMAALAKTRLEML